jgi:methionyl-tRNA synthetase
LLFEKIEDETIEKTIKEIGSNESENAMRLMQQIHQRITPSKTSNDLSTIFKKWIYRVGTILTAQRVPKTDKLLKLTIDTGIDQRNRR